jgi:hypothetical protein
MPRGDAVLYSLTSESWPSADFFFGVSIQLVDPASGQFHTGLLYRKLDNDLARGDVADHLRSRRLVAKPDSRVFWVWPDLDETNARILAVRTEYILNENEGRIPYSVAHTGLTFEDGIWMDQEPGQGLTCATFVAAVFDDVGLPFIDAATWEPRQDDAAWYESIVSYLKSKGASEEHCAVQLERVRSGQAIRVRPTDVGAAGQLLREGMLQPLEFSEVAPGAAQLEQEVRARS